MDLVDKITLITGAGSGIGRALAIRFAEKGARHVVCTDLDAASSAETVELIISKGGNASSETLDVADEEAINALVEKVDGTIGGIDIFVSNAGYGQAGGLELSTDDWQKMMNVHTWSHLAAARAVIPGMIKRGGGYLLNTASAAGLLTQINSGPYAVSKHAAVAFAEWVSINYSDQGIGVSVLCPQAVRTNILGPRLSKKSNTSKTDDSPKTNKPDKTRSSSQASGDGILEPEYVADACIDAMQSNRFLVLPHPEVETYFQRKASDYDRWLGGMRRLKAKLVGG